MRAEIGVSLVRRLVAAQFPRWAGLPLRAVEDGGWDNRTFRLGEELSVRLPSAERYAGQAEKEHRWLPKLAPHLPLAIPESLAIGAPAPGFPWPWSVRRWLDGESATPERVDDHLEFASTLARFLRALQGVDPAGGPPPGAHNFHRGGALPVYDAETRTAVGALEDGIVAGGAIAVWEAALEATWRGAPVWAHGDLSPANLLVREGRLSAVIDFGNSAVGDPACDTTMAWTFFSGRSREAFRAALPLDDATWTRGRGWALWKGLITLAGHVDSNRARAEEARRVIREVIADHGAR